MITNIYFVIGLVILAGIVIAIGFHIYPTGDLCKFVNKK